ncbi:hypothetical protein Lal_00032486 [Lupinus albus]|nr:hypothetical protein Lal_00032486 [Lupinus albus]
MLFTFLLCHSMQDEISSPISTPIFELCDAELFSDTVQNSEVTSTSNCCYEENTSYATNISPTLDVHNKINSNSNINIVTTPTSPTATSTNINNDNTTNSNNLSLIFDSQEDIDIDISASIDFSSSPSFTIPSFLPVTTHQEQFDFASVQHQAQLAPGSVLKGLLQYPTDPIVAPLMGAQLPSVFDDICISSIPSYMPLNPSSGNCSYLGPGMGMYMPPGPGNLTTTLSAESSGLFGGNILLPSELQPQELDYHGVNGGIFCTDSTQRVFNPPDLQFVSQTLGTESQQLAAGAGNSGTLAPEISNLEDSTLKVGKLSVEQRKEKIHRYMKKRNERNFSKKIKYACRKTLADSRPRVRGRFAKNDDFGETQRPASSNHEEDEEDIVVKEDADNMVDSSDIFAHISGVNSFKCNYSIQSWI